MQQPVITSPHMEIQIWPISRPDFYTRNPHKNDAVVDRMCSSIREFGFKIPVLARTDEETHDNLGRLSTALINCLQGQVPATEPARPVKEAAAEHA
jgi:hypothetical protein